MHYEILKGDFKAANTIADFYSIACFAQMCTIDKDNLEEKLLENKIEGLKKFYEEKRLIETMFFVKESVRLTLNQVKQLMAFQLAILLKPILMPAGKEIEFTEFLQKLKINVDSENSWRVSPRKLATILGVEI